MIEHLILRPHQIVIRYRSWLNAAFQSELIFISLLLAWLLRFDFQLPYPLLLFSVAPILILVRLGAITYFGLLHGWWRYTGINDTVDILKAVVTGSVTFWAILRWLLGGTSFPRSVYFLEAVLTASLLAGVRLCSRLLVESARRNVKDSKRVMLIGAGFAAQMIIREATRPGSGYTPVACVDDDPSKVGLKLHGVPVVGRVDQLPSFLSPYAVDEVLIAIPSATGAQMSQFVQVCGGLGVPFKTVPALRDIIAGHVAVSQLREVSLEDLLGREPVEIDLEAVRREIRGRTVLVTGAAGSIGSELCRQILDYGPFHLLCLDQNETGLFFLRLGLMEHTGSARLSFRVADICDTDRVRDLFAEFRPEIIFHAAAYKHVPLMETNVREAVKNNVMALVGLLDLAEEAGCKDFVLISSDKAVNPTNVMGATKRICELILSSRPGNGMRCVSVRFGNVLGSSGSVIPVLKQQLQNHQPLTITHPEMSRFFMLIPEAVALVLQAFAIGNHSDILVLDMGQSVRILDLARNLIRLSGKFEDDVEIRFTGLREGEKLHEELFYGHEKILPTSSDKIKRTRGPWREWSRLRSQLNELGELMSMESGMVIRGKIREIVPEYCFQPEDTVHELSDAQTDAQPSAAAASD